MNYTRAKNNLKLFRALLIASFSLFLLILIWAIFFKLNRYSSIVKNYKKLADLNFFERLTYHIQPFKDLDKKSAQKDFLLNMLAFAPFGIYLPLLNKKHTHLKGVLICFSVSLAVETTQLITIVGTFSSNDLIANTLGYFIGYFIYYVVVKQLPGKIINRVNTLIIAIASPIALVAMINTLSHLSVYITKTL